jgi:hypothetical protein
MNTKKFAITAEGQVYRRDGHEWQCMGHLGSILYEQSVLGRGVREWWQARLDSDEPGENIVVIGKCEPFFVPCDVGNEEEVSSAREDPLPVTLVHA